MTVRTSATVVGCTKKVHAGDATSPGAEKRYVQPDAAHALSAVIEKATRPLVENCVSAAVV